MGFLQGFFFCSMINDPYDTVDHKSNQYKNVNN